MLITKVAKRYASALLQLAEETKQLDKVLADMQMVHATIKDSRELQLFLRNKIIKEEKKKEVLAALFGKSLSELSNTFLALLVDKKREDHLFSAAGAFLKAYNQKAGILEVELHYAYEPQKKQVDALQAAIEKSTGKKVVLASHKDASLKGGLKIKIEDTVVDGTIKNKVRQLEALFTGSHI